MASREDPKSSMEEAREIAKREYKQQKSRVGKQDPKLILFLLTCVFLFFRSIDMSYRDPIVWLFNYSRNWVFLTLPYLAIRNRSIDTTTSGD